MKFDIVTWFIERDNILNINLLFYNTRKNRKLHLLDEYIDLSCFFNNKTKSLLSCSNRTNFILLWFLALCYTKGTSNRIKKTNLLTYCLNSCMVSKAHFYWCYMEGIKPSWPQSTGLPGKRPLPANARYQISQSISYIAFISTAQGLTCSPSPVSGCQSTKQPITGPRSQERAHGASKSCTYLAKTASTLGSSITERFCTPLIFPG